MAWLRGVNTDHKDVERDISLTKHEIVAYENLQPVSFKSLFATKATRRALGLSFLMIIMLDAGGNYAILAYASVIIRNAGVTVSPDLQTISFPALMALGTLASAFTVEKFGRKLRPKVLGLVCSFGWLIIALQTEIFTTAVNHFGMHSIFFFFTCINFIGAIICYLKMPETKGKTHAQIEKELEGLRG